MKTSFKSHQVIYVPDNTFKITDLNIMKYYVTKYPILSTES